MKKMALHWKIIIGMLLGVAWAFLSGWLGWSEFTIRWIDPFGTIFLNLLKLIAVPLVCLSIVSGVASIGAPSRLGKMGGKTLLVIMLNSIIAITVGLLLVNSIRPGAQIKESSRIDNRIDYENWAVQSGHEIKDGLNYRSDPSLVAIAQTDTDDMGVTTDAAQAISQRIEAAHEIKSGSPLQFLLDIVPENIVLSFSDNNLMLQVVFFGIFFGVCLLLVPEKSNETVLAMVNGVQAVFLKMIEVVMSFAPYFVFALLAGVISKMAGNDIGKIIDIFKGLSWYTGTVLFGLLLMIFVVYPMMIKLFARDISYRGYFRAMSEAQTLAFSTSSSAATLPVTMRCIEEKLGVDKKVAGFTVPVGTVINMDGTSMYQAIAVVFLAQLHMIDLTLGQQILIVVMATLVSIGAAPVPGASLVMMILVMEAVGLNPAWVAIIFPVDRILDMVRTVVNVSGDSVVGVIVAKTEGLLNYKEKK